MTVEIQNVSEKAEVTAVSWTGGKDCNLALLKAWRNPNYNVTCLVCFRIMVNKFYAHPINLMKAQAHALHLPLYFVKIPADTTDYKAAYVAGMRQLKEEHGITVMATGDMDLVGSMTQNWIQECGEEAGIRAYLPIWQADREESLNELIIKEKFHIIYSCVKYPWFDSTWIGRKLDANTIATMKEMASIRGCLEVHESGLYKPLDLGGERGEYHTMCLSGPLYHYSVEVTLDNTPLELVNQLSMKLEEEHWWAINISPTDL